ncbi:SPAG5 protein, partial [Sclerurus mexicanus]|nr:SPAG5 protein [Sclerurus mexicanus]
DGSAGPLPCQGTPEGAKSPAPACPGQSPPGLPPIEASGLEPAGSEAIITPVTSPELALGAMSWMLPPVCLKKTLSAPSLLESPRHSLSLHTSWQDGSSSVTPVPTVATGTSMTPVPTMAAGTSMAPALSADIGTFMTPRDLWKQSINTSGRGLPCAKDSTTETDSLLWHCSREQLKTLPRAELERWLESTLIIIEAVVSQLRGWQESQCLRPGVGPAEKRDVLTQTDVTCPEGVREEIYRRLYLEHQRKMKALQRQEGAEQDLQRELELAAENMGAWSGQCLIVQGLVDAARQRLQDEQGALAQTREQVRALMSQCKAVLERVPSKLQSHIEEQDALRQQVDE